MPSSYAIIGSGPSGVHAALTLLERGKNVVMYDVGIEEKEFILPKVNYYNLKENLSDPIPFFLGKDLQGMIPPEAPFPFTYPPSRHFYLESSTDYLWFSQNGFWPILSHNRGGLGVAWGANSLPYSDDDLRGFPIGRRDLEEGYQTALRRLPLAGPVEDDLSDLLGYLPPSSEPIRLNLHDSILFDRYQKSCKELLMGRARMAVENKSSAENRCIYCDRCLWGCGVGAIYNPNSALDQCFRYPQFDYIPDSFVTHLNSSGDRIESIALFNTREKRFLSFPCDVVFLAAGAIASSAIFLRTLGKDRRPEINREGKPLKSKSLLDTKVIKIPYVLASMIGRENPKEDFQFNKLIVAYLNRDRKEFPSYIHGEVLSLTSLLYHPLIESLPFGSFFSSRIFSHIKSALGVVTYFLPDRPNEANGISLEPSDNPVTNDTLKIVYQESGSQEALADELIEKTKKAFRRLGCFVSKKRALRPPPGAGIHYAGTIPMSVKSDPLCVDKNCASYAYPNLFVIDGASFPSLPSKSITLNLMANAIRVAKHVS